MKFNSMLGIGGAILAGAIFVLLTKNRESDFSVDPTLIKGNMERSSIFSLLESPSFRWEGSQMSE